VPRESRYTVQCSVWPYEKKVFVSSSFRSHCASLAAPGLSKFVSSKRNRSRKGELADAKKKKKEEKKNPDPIDNQPRVVIGTKRRSWLQRGAEGSPTLALASVRGQQKIRVRCCASQALPCRRRSTGLLEAQRGPLKGWALTSDSSVSACQCGGFRHIQVQQSDVVLATFSYTVHHSIHPWSLQS
jgi:hypothetical protein